METPTPENNPFTKLFGSDGQGGPPPSKQDAAIRHMLGIPGHGSEEAKANFKAHMQEAYGGDDEVLW